LLHLIGPVAPKLLQWSKCGAYGRRWPEKPMRIIGETSVSMKKLKIG